MQTAQTLEETPIASGALTIQTPQECPFAVGAVASTRAPINGFLEETLWQSPALSNLMEQYVIPYTVAEEVDQMTFKVPSNFNDSMKINKTQLKFFSSQNDHLKMNFVLVSI